MYKYFNLYVLSQCSLCGVEVQAFYFRLKACSLIQYKYLIIVPSHFL